LEKKTDVKENVKTAPPKVH